MIKQNKELSILNKQNDKLTKKLSLSKHCTYDFVTKTLTFYNTPVVLTKKELDLLDIFCHNINQNISYAYLKEKIWATKDISDSTVRDTFSRLKKKIPHIEFENISNFGYILKIQLNLE